MKIVTNWESTPQLWSAIDADTYDGAEDSHCPIGYGDTPEEAEADLLNQILDVEAT